MYCLISVILFCLNFFRCKVVSKGIFYEDAFSLQNTLPIRGFAAIAVYLCHLGIEPFYKYYFYLVSIFFFFSGYGLIYNFKHKKNYLKGFLNKRIFSIMIPLWIATIVALNLFGNSGLICSWLASLGTCSLMILLLLKLIKKPSV